MLIISCTPNFASPKTFTYAFVLNFYVLFPVLPPVGQLLKLSPMTSHTPANTFPSVLPSFSLNFLVPKYFTCDIAPPFLPCLTFQLICQV